MILILSTPTDTDTQLVIDWLTFLKADYFRLNDEDIMNGKTEIYINIESFDKSYISNNNIKIFFTEFKIVWFRKFGFLTEYNDYFGKSKDITRYVYTEFSVIRDLLLKILSDKKWLFKRINMKSKIEILKTAKELGLNTPKTIVTNRKSNLVNLFKGVPIISKSLYESKNIEFDKKHFTFYTSKIDSIDDILGGTFSPSIFQNYIEKDVELRIFYLDKIFYSMAIFSQKNEKTKIDFRNYDFDYPNRRVPFKLPKEIEVKLMELMDKIDINTCSIDMIKTKTGEFIFLEINPSGQFGMTSIPCNYNLHKRVAEYLIKNNN